MTIEQRAVGVSGIAGGVAAMRARVGSLQIGSTTLTDVVAVIVDPHDAGAAGDGLLPLHLFARVTFDGPQRRMVIEARVTPCRTA